MRILDNIFQQSQAVDQKQKDRICTAIEAIIDGNIDALAGTVKEITTEVEASPAKNDHLIEPLIVFADHLAKKREFLGQSRKAYRAAYNACTCSNLKRRAEEGFFRSTVALRKMRQNTVTGATAFGDAARSVLYCSEMNRLAEIYKRTTPQKSQTAKQRYVEMLLNIA